MKILFISDAQIYKPSLIGIRKKIKNQINYFQELGSTTVVTRTNDRQIFGRSLMLEKFFFWIRIWIKYRSNHFDIIYIRDLTVISGLFEFLFLRRKNVKTYVEIPTYPILSNVNGLSFISYLFNLVTRNLTWRFIMNEIFYSGNETNRIYGVKCRRINHFIGLEELKISAIDKKHPTIVMISSLQKYHGIERILVSFINSDVNANLVVIGGDRIRTQNLIKQYPRDVRITFLPYCDGDRLDQILEYADIGLSAMGLYKINLSKTSGLKVAEYAARGMHIVLGYEDDVLTDKPYTFEVRNDDSPIPFQEILEWYNKSTIPPIEIREDILKEVSWKKFMENQIFL